MPRGYTLPALLSLPLAVLLAAEALGGILLPAVYAREHPSWAAQGIGQHRVDLVFVAPLLGLSACFTLRGSRLFTLLLGGTLAYVLYSLALYAFFVHFGPGDARLRRRDDRRARRDGCLRGGARSGRGPAPRRSHDDVLTAGGLIALLRRLGRSAARAA